MSGTSDHGFVVVQDAEAFVQRLAGDKLSKAQERLAFGLVRRNSLLPWIEARSGIGPEHFPTNLKSMIVAAKTKTHEQIKEIVVSQPEGKFAQAYRKGIELNHGEALMLARQIILSLARDQANCGDSYPYQDEVTAEHQSEQPVSNQLVRHIDNTNPGTTTSGKTINNKIETSPGVANKQKPSKAKPASAASYPVASRRQTVSPKIGAEGVEKDGGETPEPPRPLMRELPPAEPFPVDALGVLAPAARAIHDRVRAPIAICGLSVLAVSTLVVQGHANVELPMGHTKPLSGFFVSIGVTGERKSGVDHEALGPVRRREVALREAHRKEQPEYENEKNAWDAARKKAIASKKGDRAAIAAALKALGPAPRPPLKPVLTCSEPTFEGLCKLLDVGQASLGVFAAEGGQFIGGHAMNDDAKLRTAAGLSAIWDGEPIKRIRALDGISVLPGRRVSMHLMVQPDVAAIWFGDPLLAEQGLLSRVLVTAPEGASGTRIWKESSPESDAAIKCYGERLLEILERPVLVANGTRNELTPRTLPLSSEARSLWISFHDHVETRLGAGGELEPVRGLANKLPEHAARIAAVLTLVENIEAHEVAEIRMANGIALAEHFVAEALRLFGASRVNPDLFLAQRLLNWLLVQWKEPKVSLPDIYQRSLNAIGDQATARRLVAILEGHGRLTRIPGGAIVAGQWRRDAWHIVREV
jgi:urease gamma subunit